MAVCERYIVILLHTPFSNTRGRLYPTILRREGLVRMWSSPCRRDGEVEKYPLWKDYTNECNESSLSNCRVQLILLKEGRSDSKKSYVRT